jgi:hypothetical protein
MISWQILGTIQRVRRRGAEQEVMYRSLRTAVELVAWALAHDKPGVKFVE